MALRIDILTLFPDLFAPFLATSIPGRAAAKGLVEYHATDLREFALPGNHHKVDDRPFGGGPGMVLIAPVVCDAVEAVESRDERPATRLLMTPAGRTLDQSLAEELATKDRLLLIAGRYEGFDERIVDELEPTEISVGDYVLSGGELAAMVVIDAVVRLLPGVLGAERGAADETFSGGLLEHPQYTRPAEWRGRTIPPVLTGGDHAAVDRWKRQQREERTRQRRPDLWAKHESSQARHESSK